MPGRRAPGAGPRDGSRERGCPAEAWRPAYYGAWMRADSHWFRPLRRVVWLGVGTLPVLAILLLIIAHLPVVRAAVLSRLGAVLLDQSGIRLSADRLDYRLWSLAFELRGVRLSGGEIDRPFFEAAAVAVDLPWRVLRGEVAVERLAIAGGVVRHVRDAAGRTNLPSGSAAEGSEPAPLDLEQVEISMLAIEVDDAPLALRVRAPSVALALAPQRGRLAIGAPVEVARRDVSTVVTALEGDLAFDGRDLALTDLVVRSREGSLRLDGQVALRRATPSLALAITGDVDLGQAARWLPAPPEEAAGRVAVDGRVEGPLDAPVADLEATSRQLRWGVVEVSDLAARARVSADGVELPGATAILASGRVSLAASVPFGDGAAARAAATWSGVDAGTLAGWVASPPVRPAGTLSGRFEGTGPLADLPEWQAAAVVTLSAAVNRPGRLAMPGEIRARLARGRWRLDARLELGGVARATAAVSGALADDPAAASLDGTIEVRAADIATVVQTLDAVGLIRTAGEYPLRGSAELALALAGSMAHPRAGFELNGERLAFGEWDVAHLRARGSADPRRIVVVDLSAGQAEVVGDGTVSGRGEYDLGRHGFSASADIRSWSVAIEDPAALAGVASGRIDVHGTPARPEGTATLIVDGLDAGGVAVGRVAAGVEFAGGAARIQARVPDFDASADIDVDLAAPYAATARLVAERLDVGRAVRGMDTPVPLTGHVNLRLEAAAPLERWQEGRASARVEAADVRAGDLIVRTEGPTVLRVDAGRLHVDRLELAVGGTHVSGVGAIDVLDGSGVQDPEALLVTMTGDLGAVVQAVAATGVASVPVVDAGGPAALLARVSGAVTAPVVVADLELGPGRIRIREDLPEVTSVQVRARSDGETVEIREAHASFEGARLEAAGRAPLALLTRRTGTASGEWALQARVSDVTAAVLRPMLDPGAAQQMEGQLDATVELRGGSLTLEALAGSVQLDRLELTVAGLPVRQRVPTRMAIGDGFARVTAWDWAGEGATLGVRGQVNLATRDTALLADGTIDLRLLAPFLREAGLATAGRLASSLSVTGPVGRPRIDGMLTLTEGEVRVAEPRVAIAGLAARAVLSHAGAHLTSLTATANGAPLSARGEVSFLGENGPGLRLEAMVEGMPLEVIAGLRTEIDADVALSLAGSGSRDLSGRLTGLVTVRRGSYREQIAVVTGLLARLRADALTTRSAAEPGIGDRVELDVRVLTDEDLVVDNNLARVELGADLRAIGTLNRPALSGRAEIREGGQLFLGRNRYTLTAPGVLDFTNPVTIDPEVNIAATTRVGGYTIDVRLSGTVSNPGAPELGGVNREDAPIGQADAASLLLTGRTLDELGAGDAAAIGAEVLGNLSGDVLGFAGRAVGLDVRLGAPATGRTDPTDAATELDPTSRLTFGRSFGTRLDVTYSQSLRNGEAQTWIVDYLPTRRLGLRFVSDDNDLRAYEFRHDVSVGGGPAMRAARPGRPPRRVTAVEFRGDTVVPDARLRRAVRLAAGRRFDYLQWQDDRDRLHRLYVRERRFSARIAASREEEPDGVRLVYEIEAGPETRIAVEGAQLSARTFGQIESLWAESAFDVFLVEEAGELVRRALLADGYLDSTVELRFDDQPGVRTLIVRVEPGPRVTGTVARIEGADAALAADLDAWLASTGGASQAVAEPAAVERGMRDWLRARGHLDARAAVAAPTIEGSTGVVRVAVDAGPQFVIGAVMVEGAQSVAEDLVRLSFGVVAGRVHDAAAIEAGRTEVQGLLRREGFPQAVVAVRQQRRAEPIVDLVVAVEEGPRQVIAAIEVSGQRGAAEDVIRNALQLEVGSPLRTADWVAARRRLFDTGLFRRVDVSADALDDAAPGGRTLPVRVRVLVEEWPGLRLRYGFQVVEERPEEQVTGRDLVPGFTADLVRRTLFGRAVTLGGAVDLRTRDQSGRLFARAPTAFGLPIESLLTGERSRRPIAGSGRIDMRTGVSWEQRIRLRDRLRASYSYRFERSRTDLPPDELLGPLPPVVVNLGRLIASAAWDSRDDPLDTTRGTFLSSVLEYAPEALGSDIRFVKTLVQAYRFQPWRGLVFASAARVGMARALGGQELILSERFFAGGARTVRGVAEEGLGPRGFFGDPDGGEGLLVLNQEVRVPIFRWVRGVGFVDAGTVASRVRDLSLGGLTGSAGFGLRLATPVALLRVDYGRVFWNGAGSRWTFGIGQAF